MPRLYKRRKYGRLSKRRYSKRRFARRLKRRSGGSRKKTYSIGRINRNMSMPTFAKFVKITNNFTLGNQNSYNAIKTNTTYDASYWNQETGFSEMFSIYQKYRIVKLQLKYEFFPPPYVWGNALYTTASGSSLELQRDFHYQRKPEWAFWKDTTGKSPIYAASESGWEDIMNRDKVHVKRSNFLNISWKPVPHIESEESSVTSGQFPSQSNPWLSTDETGINYYGMNVYLNNANNEKPTALNGTAVQKLRFHEIAYIEFKDRRR
ncbi:capsid protein [Apis mellifera virus-9]|nr:putative capsid protein [Apis mellifera virus-9]QBX89289.1 putative capsid protein [Apis mellifera virus-9]QBX89291.1 capsid protein [Apis mellifera virus-9]QBX89293.1 capsid protein [Apis mellifera virus-9]QBX89295.1 capsid protein [Apis mellifera virus-9]